MKEIEWYYPESLEEVPLLLKKEGVIPHGGGTGIIRTRMNRIRGLIDLGRLPLHSLYRRRGRIDIGASETFAEVAEQLPEDHVLSHALSLSASTPLRNRITVGGSVALFPAWSDLMGPLIALEADVSLLGSKGGIVPITRYLSEPPLRSKRLITGISFNDDHWLFSYFRHTRTQVDYPAFTVTILMKKAGARIEDVRIVVVGCIGKYRRLQHLEDWVKGAPPDRVESLPETHLSFTGKKFMSPEYLEHCAAVELERGISRMLRG